MTNIADFFKLDIVPNEIEILNEAIQMEIWRYVWRENYAQTILQFADREHISDRILNVIQPESNLYENHLDHIEQPSNNLTFSVNYQQCAIL